jgi:hypothetical protein
MSAKSVLCRLEATQVILYRPLEHSKSIRCFTSSTGFYSLEYEREVTVLRRGKTKTPRWLGSKLDSVSEKAKGAMDPVNGAL